MIWPFNCDGDRSTDIEELISNERTFNGFPVFLLSFFPQPCATQLDVDNDAAAATWLDSWCLLVILSFSAQIRFFPVYDGDCMRNGYSRKHHPCHNKISSTIVNDATTPHMFTQFGDYDDTNDNIPVGGWVVRPFAVRLARLWPTIEHGGK